MPDPLARQVLRVAALFIGIILISFCILHLAPGSPTDSKTGFNPSVTPEVRAKLNRLYGLDKPVSDRLAVWLHDAILFDFGTSFVDGEKVSSKIEKALPLTLLINLTALGIGLIAGIPLGIWMAVHRGKNFVKILDGALLGILSAPSFWIALTLMSWLSVRWRVFPVSGLHSLFHTNEPWIRQWLDLVWHLVLPVCVFTLPVFAVVARYVSSSTEKELGQNYVRAARSRGLSERTVLYRHVMRNALLPVVTLVGLSIPGLLGGSVVLESLFALPGMGRLFYQSVFQRDYPVIMGILVLGSAMTLLGNALADAIYSKVDPRIQGEAKKNR